MKIVVCDEPQNCGTVKELEAEVKQQDKALMSQEKRYWEKVKELKDAESRLAKALGVLEEAPFPDVAQFGQFCSCFHLWKKELEAALGGGVSARGEVDVV